MIEFKGYKATLEYDDETEMFHGRVIGSRDLVTFEGKSVRELKKAFKDSMNDYFEFCIEQDIKPEKPYSGKFNIRLTTELHRQVAMIAESKRISLNEFVVSSLTQAVNHVK